MSKKWYNKNILMMYAIHLIENDINLMPDTTSIINSTVSFYLYISTVVYSQCFNGVGAIHIKASV